MESKYQIVCVDDDKDVLDILVDTIEDLGYSAQGFTSPQIATEFIEKNRHQIVLILSDLRMDDVNGFEFKRDLPKLTQEIPFVIITGYWTQEMSAKAMEIGIEAFLEKPVKAEILKDQIDRFAKKREETLNEEREMVEGFLDETTPMLDEIESLILELEESSDKEQTLSVYFRLLHTIKGTASCVGLTRLGDYTHKYEDFIGELRNKVVPVNTGSINVLLSGLDDLKQFFKMVDDVGNDNEVEFQHLIGKFTDLDKLAASTNDTEEKEVQKEQVVDNKKSAEDDKMTVSMSVLNQFMEESGELTVIRNSILKTVNKIEGRYRGDEDIEQLNELLTGMYSVTSNIQNKITEMRKVPLKNTFRPFKRLVRDLCKKLGKDVELEIKGEDLLVDNIVAKLYSNTMIHIIRNSLDHGIETIAKREEKGKNPTGKLTIEAYPLGEDIVLKVSDDGNGVDPEIIKNKAIEKGLYTPEEIADMSSLQIINIIFDSGFSTAEQVSDLSGRGVGMDMVRGSFRDMGGEVYVQSEKGQGSIFTLKVPIPKSVLIINTLSVENNGKIVLFQMEEVAEVLQFNESSHSTRIFETDGQKMLEQNNEMIELLKLSDIFEEPYNEPTDGHYNIVILRVGEKKFGLIVDTIFEFEEVVLRKITPQIHSHSLYHGASLVGAGEVAMIVSSEGIAHKMGLEIKQVEHSLAEVEEKKVSHELSEYMIFDYTDTHDQLCINLSQVDRFERISPDKIERIGTNFIIRYLDRNLLLVDPGHVLGLTDECRLENGHYQQLEDFDVIVIRGERKLMGLIVNELGEIVPTEQVVNLDTVNNPGLKGSLYLDGVTVCEVDVDYIEEKTSKRMKIQVDNNFKLAKAA